MSKIGEVEIKAIHDALELMVEEFSKIKGNPKPDRKGGFFVMRDNAAGIILLKMPIGEIDPEKTLKYARFAQEKGKRLYQNQSLGHVSSWESRDEEAEKYSGAILAGHLILSFSGLPEWGDEAVILVLALRFDWINEQQVKTIIQISENPFFEELYKNLYGKVF